MVTKLNLASGSRCLPDWINIDNSLNAKLAKHPTLDYLLYKIKIVPKEYYDEWQDVIQSITLRDIRKGLPFDDESVDFIYSSHFIEHMTPEEFNSVLNECYRVLKKGGLIRLTTPDLEKLANRYVGKVQQERNEKASQEFLRILFNLDETSELPFLIRNIRKRVYVKHKYAYDACSLTHLLKIKGFVNIQKQHYQVGRMPEIQFLDSKPDQSLYIEAEKPRQS